jgi:multiple sugar transport system permease protein/putative aldouronate transport system permease protein
MAFKRYQPRMGVWGSPWIGLYQFERLFSSAVFPQILRNTITLNIYGLVAGFPFPIILALFINHCFFNKFKKVVQTITFAPHFLSTVIVVGLIVQALAMRTGVVNLFLKSLGLAEVEFMGIPGLFPHIYVWSGIWQGTGWGAVIYIATLAGVDPNLHEAAIIDGANLAQRMWHIDLSTIKPMIVIMLIMSMGGLLGSSFEKIYLLQNTLNMEVSEVIATYSYRVGLAAARPDYSFGTAIGLFQNIVGIILTLGCNKICQVFTGTSMY